MSAAPTYILVYAVPNGGGDIEDVVRTTLDKQAALDKYAEACVNGAGNVQLFKAEPITVTLTARVIDVDETNITAKVTAKTREKHVEPKHTRPPVYSRKVDPARPPERVRFTSPPSEKTKEAWKAPRVQRAMEAIRKRLERAKGPVPSAEIVTIDDHTTASLYYGLSKLARDKVVERVRVKGVVCYQLWTKG